MQKLPVEEKYDMISQAKRASVSIMTNISEGVGRRINKDFVNFLGFAHGSSTEVENLLIASMDLGYINLSDFKEQESYLHEIQKCLMV